MLTPYRFASSGMLSRVTASSAVSVVVMRWNSTPPTAASTSPSNSHCNPSSEPGAISTRSHTPAARSANSPLARHDVPSAPTNTRLPARSYTVRSESPRVQKVTHAAGNGANSAAGRGSISGAPDSVSPSKSSAASSSVRWKKA